LDDGLKSLDVIGKVPPPFGGVSVHTGRLACYAGVKGWRVRVFDFSKREKFRFAQNVTVYPFGVHSPFALVRILCSRSIIHFHGGPWFLWCFFGFLGLLGRKVLLGVHPSDWLVVSYARKHVFKRWLFRACCRGFSCVAVPHKWVEQVVSGLGLPFRKIVRMNSNFIPPVSRSQNHEAVPNEVWDFVKDHSPVLGGCGYRLNFKDGIDVYGLDLLIPLIHRLRHSDFPNSGVVFVLPHVDNYAYFNELKRMIKELNVEKHMLFVHGERKAYPVWPHLDVFIRPTLVDAGSFSVRECLCVGIPVVASDCVERPKEVVTFKCRDLEDLEDKVKIVLGQVEKYRVKNCKSSADDFIKLYEQLAGLNHVAS
jgi:glycosyltransferase involved in cell wall biosynthesis